MLPGYCASAETQFLEAIDVPKDPYVAVSIHAYTPYDFTMNTAVKDHSVFTSAYSTNLANILQGMRDTFLDNNIPVIIGEMGTSNFNNTEARVAWTTQYFTTTKKYGIPCCLWDNNTVSNPKDPGECHGYINRETGEWYQSSLPVINKMMEIINDKSIVWGSEGKMPTFDHKDLSTGKVFLENAVIDVAKEKEYGNSTPGKEISWNDLKGKEVAIKYTGDVPVLAVSDKDYKGWTEMAAYTVDEDNKIAYYLVDQQVPAAWSGDLANINHMQARTPGKTNIEKMVILDAPDAKIDVPVDKTKKTNIDFANAQAGDNLIIKIKGEPNTDTNGCVGFNGDGWEQIEWEGKTDANGALTVEIPMSKFPTGLQSAEAQIWYQAELVDFDGYNFGKAEVTTTTTTTATTTTTTTSSTTTSTSTTTVTESSTTSTDATTTTTVKVPDKKSTGNGDANQDGQVDMSDVVLIMQSLANPNKYKLDDKAASAADVYENNGVTAQDALAIQCFLLKKIAALPVPEGVIVK